MSEVAKVCMTYSEDLMKPISVRLWYLWLTGIPGLPPPPGKFSHQYSCPSWRHTHDRKEIWQVNAAPLVSWVLCEFDMFNPLVSKLHHERTSFRLRLKPMAKTLQTGSAWRVQCALALTSKAISSHAWGQHKHKQRKHKQRKHKQRKHWAFSLRSTPKTCPN